MALSPNKPSRNGELTVFQDTFYLTNILVKFNRESSQLNFITIKKNHKPKRIDQFR